MSSMTQFERDMYDKFDETQKAINALSLQVAKHSPCADLQDLKKNLWAITIVFLTIFLPFTVIGIIASAHPH